MRTATFHQPSQMLGLPRRPTHLRRTVWVIPLLLVGLGLGGLLWLLYKGRNVPQEVTAVTDAGNWPAWLKQATTYTPTKEPVSAKPPERDLVAEELARLRAQLAEQQRMLEELKRRPQPQPAKTPEPPPKVEKRKAGAMLYIKHEGKEVPKTGEPTYTIMPGYFIPCAIETAMNSDTGDITFVAIVTSTVYDTETGHHPLILQSSKIVGEGQGSALLYGNERLRTVSLTLSRRQDKAPIELGEAPLTDQARHERAGDTRRSAFLAPGGGSVYWWGVARWHAGRADRHRWHRASRAGRGRHRADRPAGGHPAHRAGTHD